MNYSQFISLVKQRPSGGMQDASLLSSFLEKYPYCQSAHILYSKFLREAEDLQADAALRLAAVYAGDRNKLQQLTQVVPMAMAEGQENIFLETAVAVREEPSVFSALVETSLTESTSTENIFETPAAKPFFSAEVTSSNSSSNGKVYLKEEPVTSVKTGGSDSQDPHEIIRRRLNEILSGKKPVVENTPKQEPVVMPVETPPAPVMKEQSPVAEVLPVHVAEKEALPQDTISEGAEEVILRREIMQMNDDVDKEELAHIAGESALQTLEKSGSQAEGQASPMAFTAWLREKSVASFGNIEEVNAGTGSPITVFAPGKQPEETKTERPATEVPTKTTATPASLIERFIATEPRISPSKTEFYSPAIQAKRSVEEDENLITETLARIYLEQGMLVKARAAYMKLSLLNPEKSSSFAALVEEIDKTLNTEE
jgi:hypothetical protein